ncbi:RNA pseudouridine synthase 3, mitochondrial-like [Phragmites australis]|uniref:RNA pseudouridine synthase 3, mitochondrial-like n=1 Tax=Phragmites australis TaxID=29695 RepID=UPI002D791281|nr:RNA pseudouridine synthase 3, mitochondrial-like [Phragmites australis]
MEEIRERERTCEPDRRTLCRGSRRPGPWRWPAALRRLPWLAPPTPAAADPVVSVDNNKVARLGASKPGSRPRQLLSLPPFPAGADKLPGRKAAPRRVTAVSWVKHYFDDVPLEVLQAHFNRRMVCSKCHNHEVSAESIRTQKHHLKKIKHNDVMEPGMRIHLPVSVAEGEIKKRYETIPTATLHPNKDEIEYLRRLVIYRDSAILMLNKPPKVPMKGYLPVHNSMDVLAAAALPYGNEEGPKLVHRLDRESSDLILMGRTKESFTRLHWLFTSINLARITSQLRVHCAEARHSHRRRLQIWVACAPKVEAESQPDFEPFTGEPYKPRRPEGLEVQNGSVLSKIPLLHLHCREMVVPNIAKFLSSTGEWHDDGAQGETQPPKVHRTNAFAHEN